VGRYLLFIYLLHFIFKNKVIFKKKLVAQFFVQIDRTKKPSCD
jgi:hypothetical protein